jgi:predicted sulfurtransferase
MEQDFQVFDEKTTELIKKYKIDYKWRDSCLNQLIESKKCSSEYFYASTYYCKDLFKAWQQCQFERETKIIVSENLKPVPEEQRKKSY